MVRVSDIYIVVQVSEALLYCCSTGSNKTVLVVLSKFFCITLRTSLLCLHPYHMIEIGILGHFSQYISCREGKNERSKLKMLIYRGIPVSPLLTRFPRKDSQRILSAHILVLGS